MSTVLVASWRITIPYTVTGQNHKVHAYARIATTTPSFGLRHRDLTTVIPWTDAADQFNRYFGDAFLPAAATWGTVLLEQLVGSLWQPQATHSVTGTQTGTTIPASQVTVVLRDTTFKKIRLVALDTKYQPPIRWANLPTGTVIDNNLVEWTGAYTDTASPFLWQVGRSNNFLQADPIAGISVDLNDKLRRARGL